MGKHLNTELSNSPTKEEGQMNVENKARASTGSLSRRLLDVHREYLHLEHWIVYVTLKQSLLSLEILQKSLLLCPDTWIPVVVNSEPLFAFTAPPSPSHPLILHLIPRMSNEKLLSQDVFSGSLFVV
ncbi:unnamed protein product [Hymenolepis diminuta]|uniref:Uncharacterized protein n=1 Tax=Hymenolepis diminuta TaxID=6216 RepID=A0A564Z0E0_HYMDI|nr:unnamed protein product [Hymenolepis diminuta]VUZ40709.1 unnamed protein product [Hymenolepis diminuta]VUZ52423.1 unnamed protein product [Hymenolepis diminuta]